MEDVLAERLSRVSKFDLPSIPCSIPLECHPEFSRISEVTDAWAIRMLGITDPYERQKAIQARFGLLTALATPRGESSKLEVASKHFWTFFVLDDIAETDFGEEEGQKAADILLEVAEGSYVFSEKEKQKNPSYAMFEEVMSSFRSLMDPPLFARYMTCLKNFLDSVVEEASLRFAKSIPSLEKYQLLRRETVFVEASGGIMCEFCMDLKLDKGVVESPEFVAFVKAVVDHAALVNDLLSFRHEMKIKCFHNYLCVIFFHSPDNASFQETVDKVCKMIQENEAEILQLQKKVMKMGVETGNKDLVEYATWYPCFASGHLRWSYVTGRYHGLDNPLLNGEPFHGTWFLHPEVTLMLPFGSKCGDHPWIARS
ncbi:(E)-2-epi-beta-caryophyllene synthase-like [Selaginella moellendorffii]|uniref:(E)-2-epi-beta-caryophyllene synthase-like n=1 Tax=Selaginella moellendorffii TaxID=88036 RepID=UPI000D1CC587|nr:(E)-2-epi-beta-caryophyllene synthase-like [Selaginella moellendorffii]|eukprot:XP_024535052.1 (E)-2-epi-beta-caryophyllene synthase-like [Selaginella moellendorffii]